ncbi:hypothetical protein MTP99_015332 [Tenebrio molitor]|nr:hypothetical protein MTP99_015332 [Tenebrio molitor]
MNTSTKLILLTLFFIIVWFFYKSFWRLLVFSSQLDGPLAYPLLGNTLRCFCKKEEVLNVTVSSIEPYRSPTRVWIGPRLLVVVKDPHQLKIILQSSKIAKKSHFYKFFKPFLGRGLFTASGPTHKLHKKLIQPLFSSKMIEGYCYLFQKHADVFVERLRQHAGGPPFDIIFYLRDTVFESTIDLLMADANVHSVYYKDIPKYLLRIFDIVVSRIQQIWLHWDYIYEKTFYFKEQTRIRNIMTTWIAEIMNTKVPETVERLKNDTTPSRATRIPSIVEMLVEMVPKKENCLSVQDCMDQLITLMATSHDTQSSAVAFTCMMLGANPDIQNLVVKELREVLGEKKTLDMSDVSKLKYLEMCIKETLRLYPVAPFAFRDTGEDFQLDKMTIPKHVTVVLAFYMVHRDPRYWERPNEFYPEHFSPEATRKRHPFAFLPFSAGARKCIAQQYSYTLMKILLGTILLNFELESDRKVEDIMLTTDVSIRPIDGYSIKIKNRIFC